jgi:chromosome segregation ATPase
LGKPALLGGINFTVDEAAKLKSLAKKSITFDDKIAANKKKIAALDTQISDLNSKLRDAQLEAKHWYQELQDLKEKVKDYLHFAAKFPARVKEFFTGLFREEQAQERQLEQERQLQRHTKKKTYDRGR